MEQLRELSKTEIILAFASSCIETVARKLSLSYDETYRKMKKADIFSRIIFPHYDILHSESREVVTQRIIEYLEAD